MLKSFVIKFRRELTMNGAEDTSGSLVLVTIPVVLFIAPESPEPLISFSLVKT